MEVSCLDCSPAVSVTQNECLHIGIGIFKNERTDFFLLDRPHVNRRERVAAWWREERGSPRLRRRNPPAGGEGDDAENDCGEEEYFFHEQ